jgi:uncharacterized iron-regulated membrane protein
LLELPTDSGDYFLAFTKDQGEDAGAIRAVIVDPVTGGVLADRPFGGYFVSFMRRIHTSLLLEDPGHWIVGALGLLGLISFGTGLYLWWPRAGAWRKALSFHWQRRAVPFNFELHRISGFYLLVVLIVVTGSGIYLATPQPIDAAVEALTEATPYPESMQVNAPFRGAPRQTLQQTAKIVRDRIPAAVLTGFYIPLRDDESYTAYFRGPDEPDSTFGRSALWIDPYTGKVLYERSYVRLGAMDRFLALQILLHNGEIAGTLGEWIVFLSGIVMTALFATGVYLWWAKRRPRRRTALDPRSQEASAFQRSS